MDNPSSGSFDLNFGDSNKTFDLRFGESNRAFGMQLAQSNKAPVNYNSVFNRPKINSVTLVGNIPLQQLGLRAVYYDTTANWDLQRDIIGEEGALYIYSDYKHIDDDYGNRTYIPGIRIGDGKAYLIDLPFLSDAVTEAFINSTVKDTVDRSIAQAISDHMEANIHVSSEERLSWNTKVTAYTNPDNPENLILTI